MTESRDYGLDDCALYIPSRSVIPRRRISKAGPRDPYAHIKLYYCLIV